MPRYAEPIIKIQSCFEEDDDDEEFEDDVVGIALTPFEKCRSPKPPPKAPVLKIQTNFDPHPGNKYEFIDDDEDEERTARPRDCNVPFMLQPWNSSSIDQVLSSDLWSAAESSPKIGPMTPKGYDDISPTTRGEWGFMIDNALQAGRTVAVETW